MNTKTFNNIIYLTRHGESTAQKQKIIGTDADLTQNGIKYATHLKQIIDAHSKKNEIVDVMCSTLQRSIKTANIFMTDNKYNVKQLKQLNEISGGEFEGQTYDQVKMQWPIIYELRQNDKFNYSWPGGESYRQMIIRLESIFVKIKQSEIPIVIVAHQAVCRAIYAYLINIEPEKCIEIDIMSHTIYKFEYNSNHPQVTELK